MSIHTTPGHINPYPSTLEENNQNWRRFAKFAAAGAVGVDAATGQFTIATALTFIPVINSPIPKTSWSATWSNTISSGTIGQIFDGIYNVFVAFGSPQNNHLVVNLGAKYTLSRLVIFHNVGTVTPTSYTIEVSPDNVTYTTVNNNVLGTLPTTDLTFPVAQVNMQYVRITPNSGTANGNWHVAELDIYGGGTGLSAQVLSTPTVGVTVGSVVRISGAFKKNASTDDFNVTLGDATSANGYRLVWTAAGIIKLQRLSGFTPTDIGTNVAFTSDTAQHYFNAVIVVTAFNDVSIVAQIDGSLSVHVDNDTGYDLTAQKDTVSVFTGSVAKLVGWGFTTSSTINGPTGSYPLTAGAIPSTLGNTTIPTLTITGSIVYPAQVANTFWGGPTTGANATPTFRALVAADVPTTLGNITIGNLTITGALTLPTKAANLVFAGPTTGAAAVPAFRSLVAADIPGTLGNTAIGNLTVSGITTNATDGNTSGGITIKNVSTSTAPIVVDTPTFQIADLQTWKAAGATKANITAAGLMTVTGLTVSGSVQGAITFAGNILAQGNLTLQGTGNFTNVPTLPNQSNATIFAGPATGAAATPTFRAMAATDLPGGNWIGNTNGETTMAAPFTLSTNATYSNTGLTVSLPAAGTYRVEGQIRASMGTSMTSAFVTAKLFNATAAADVANSTVLVAILPTPQATAYMGSVVTVAAATTLALYAQLTFTGTLAPTQIQSDSNGWTKLAFTRIA